MVAVEAGCHEPERVTVVPSLVKKAMIIPLANVDTAMKYQSFMFKPDSEARKTAPKSTKGRRKTGGNKRFSGKKRYRYIGLGLCCGLVEEPIALLVL